MSSNNYIGLGRGLETLLKTKPANLNTAAVSTPVAETALTNFRTVPVFNLKSGKYQPRKNFDDNALKALAGSIKSQGLVQPIIVQPLDGRNFEIIAGERRWRAAQIAGLEEVPVVIRNDIQPQQAMALALVENIQREDLNAIEEAQALLRLHEEFHLTHEQIADVVGRSRTAITNSLRLLDLPPTVQSLVKENLLKMGHARALLSLDEEQQVELANRAVATKIKCSASRKVGSQFTL